MAEGDAHFPRDDIGVQHRRSAGGFQGAFERPQRRHPAAAGDLQRHVAFANRQRQHAVRGLGCRGLQGRDAQGKAQRLQLRRPQRLLQQPQMILRNTYQDGVLLARRGPTARTGYVQSLDVVGKSALRFNLQETGNVALGQVGHVGVHDQYPLERQTDDALALMHALGEEMIAKLAPDQFRVVGQWVQRHRSGERVTNLARTVRPFQRNPVQPAAVKG